MNSDYEVFGEENATLYLEATSKEEVSELKALMDSMKEDYKKEFKLIRECLLNQSK